MQLYQNKSLKVFNTFGIDVTAEKFISVETEEELYSILRDHKAPDLFILGGGSNILLTKNVEKTVLHVNLKGKQILQETEEQVVVEAMAGENWHEFVLWCLEQGFGGLENLSLIPGNVGTAPIQNIGAYGIEIKDRFASCSAIDIRTLETKEFFPEDCDFAYRNSVFKTSEKGKYIITSVSFRLSKKNHKLTTSYGSIDTLLSEKGIKKPTIKNISDTVIEIRESKLPNPKILGNSGSFFKNPIIKKEELFRLQDKFPEIPFYPVSEKMVKIPAGWMIEKAGLKGFRKGDAGVDKRQALVLVNYGQATGQDILQLAKQVQEKILDLFGIQLEPEVNIV